MNDELKDVETDDKLTYFNESLHHYIKIIALYFILPLWLVGFVHTGIAGWKVYNWFDQNIHFLQNTQYIVNTLEVRGDDEKNRTALANRATAKLDSMEQEIIASIVPQQFLLLVPLDIVFLIYYFGL